MRKTQDGLKDLEPELLRVILTPAAHSIFKFDSISCIEGRRVYQTVLVLMDTVAPAPFQTFFGFQIVSPRSFFAPPIALACGVRYGVGMGLGLYLQDLAALAGPGALSHCAVRLRAVS